MLRMFPMMLRKVPMILRIVPMILRTLPKIHLGFRMVASIENENVDFDFVDKSEMVDTRNQCSIC